MSKAAKPGRPRLSRLPRQVISASIAYETDQEIYAWVTLLLKSNSGAHVGAVLDLLVHFGKKYGFAKTLPRKSPSALPATLGQDSRQVNPVGR